MASSKSFGNSDLAVAKSVDNEFPFAGDQMAFTIDVTNFGPNEALSVQVQDLVPTGYSWVSDTGSGAYDNGTGAWTIGGLLATAPSNTEPLIVDFADTAVFTLSVSS